MKKITIILGHPCSKKVTFSRSLAEAYIQGAEAAGHSAELIDISKLDIPYLTQKSDYDDLESKIFIKDAQEKLSQAHHWVIIYPLWLGTYPSKLKAFFEWVLSPGFAYESSGNGMPVKLLKGKSGRIVITMGMPAFFYRWGFGAHSLKALEKSILKFVGISPVKETLFGFVEGVSDKKRETWLKKMEKLGGQGS